MQPVCNTIFLQNKDQIYLNQALLCQNGDKKKRNNQDQTIQNQDNFFLKTRTNISKSGSAFCIISTLDLQLESWSKGEAPTGRGRNIAPIAALQVLSDSGNKWFIENFYISFKAQITHNLFIRQKLW